jgi:hypothetical protein
MAELLKTGRKLKKRILALKTNTNHYWKELLPEVVSPVSLEILKHMGSCETLSQGQNSQILHHSPNSFPFFTQNSKSLSKM